MKTELKKSCSKCKYADWDADGCTCMIEKRLIGNAFAYVCDNFSSEKPLTNGDRIRQMTDEELAEYIGSSICDRRESGDCLRFENCEECKLSWIREEAEDGES